MTSSSRIDPPGAMIAVQPPSTAASKPSANGKEPVAGARRPARQRPGAPAAICTALTRLVCPAQIPRVVPLFDDDDAVALDVTHDVPREREVVPFLRALGCRLLTTRHSSAARRDRRLRRARRRARCARAARAPARPAAIAREPHDAQVLSFSRSSSASASNSGAATISRKNSSARIAASRSIGRVRGDDAAVRRDRVGVEARRAPHRRRSIVARRRTEPCA